MRMLRRECGEFVSLFLRWLSESRVCAYVDGMVDEEDNCVECPGEGVDEMAVVVEEGQRVIGKGEEVGVERLVLVRRWALCVELGERPGRIRGLR